jgi:PAS domain S-box-containing protein
MKKKLPDSKETRGEPTTGGASLRPGETGGRPPGAAPSREGPGGTTTRSPRDADRRDGPAKKEEASGEALRDALRDSVVLRPPSGEEYGPDELESWVSRWGATFNAITDIVLVISTDGRIMDINAAGCAAVRMEKHEALGQSCDELASGTKAPIGRCPWKELTETREPQTTVTEKDGRTFELTLWPVPGADGGLKGAVQVITDVTERRKAEQELTLFRKLIDHANDIIHVVDPETGRILDVNEQGCAASGYTREEYCTLTVFDIDATLDQAGFEEVIDALRRTGSYLVRGAHGRKDGSSFPVEANVTYVKLDREYLVTAIRDITDRKQAEETIQRALDTQEAVASILRLSLDDSPLETLLAKVLDKVLSIPWLSVQRKGAVFLVGDEPGVLVLRASEGLADEIGECCGEVGFGHCLCGLAAERGELLHTGEINHRHDEVYDGMAPHGHYCVPISHGDEVLGLLNTYVAPGHTYSEQEASFLTAVADALAGIVVRKRSEEERAKAEEHLELVQRLEAVGRLAGGVAHDFNNLLSVIINYSELAARELHDSDPVKSDILEVQKAGERAASLTRQLLAFSRKQVLEPEVLDLNESVSALESMLRRLLGEDIEIVVELSEHLRRIEADPGQIEQVIMNLAVNARDAMPRGGKLIIETTDVELDQAYADRHVGVEPGPHVLLAVTDTGCGIDAETKEHIFEPFYTTKKNGKGTGLGLSMVYGIVKQSGGNIWVYSEPGQGTTFKVYLPRVDAPTVAKEKKGASSVVEGSETVLLVEDEEGVRRLAERILTKAGYQVISARGGGDALLWCEKRGNEIDLLLTDVVMPQMSGAELAARAAKLHPDMKLLYMSGYTDDAIVEHGVLDPGTNFIGKPFTAAALTQKVREVLDEG